MVAQGRLELASKLYQHSVLPRVEAIASGQTLDAPIVVELDPTSFCDLVCPECVSGPLLQQARFTRERLMSLGAELIEAGVRAVVLIGGGEPLMHPAIGDLIEILGSAGVQVGLTTNGTLLDRYMQPIALHAAWTRVSVDAASQETYQRFRPHRGAANVFTQVIAGMRRLARVKQGALGYSFVLLGRYTASGTLITSNYGELRQAARLAKDIGCDYFEVKPEYDLAHRLRVLPETVTAQLRRDLDYLDGLSDVTFEVVSPTTLRNVIDGGRLEQPKTYQECPVAKLRTLISASGAYICPYHRGRAAARFGDPQVESFETMWLRHREGAVGQATSPMDDCQFHCIRHETNQAIIEMAEAHAPPAKAIPDYDLFI